MQTPFVPDLVHPPLLKLAQSWRRNVRMRGPGPRGAFCHTGRTSLVNCCPIGSSLEKQAESGFTSNPHHRTSLTRKVYCFNCRCFRPCLFLAQLSRPFDHCRCFRSVLVLSCQCGKREPLLVENPNHNSRCAWIGPVVELQGHFDVTCDFEKAPVGQALFVVYTRCCVITVLTP